MAFWGVEVEPGNPITLKANEETGLRRLHLSHATLGGIAKGTCRNRNILVCNVGNRRPLYLCVLSPEKVDSCQLNLEFDEADEVIFSVIGPLSIHITGYFLGTPTAFRPNDDEFLARADDEVKVFGRRDLSDYELPEFYERIYKLVDDPSLDSIISWSKKSYKSFIIRNPKKLFRRKIYSRFPFCSTFEKFISRLKYYGFTETKRSDGLLEFGNENFVRGQPMLMKEMHIKTVMKSINKDLMEFKA